MLGTTPLCGPLVPNERIEVSVRDRVVDALERDISEPLKVEVQSSTEQRTSVRLAVTVYLPEGSHVEQAFHAQIERVRMQVSVRPLEPIRIVGNDGVTRVLAHHEVGKPSPDARNNHSFLVTSRFSCRLSGSSWRRIRPSPSEGVRSDCHAVGFAGAALIAAGGYYLIIHAITSSSQDRNVASDLRSLLDSNFTQYDSVGPCAHQSGNQYVCTVTRNGSPVTVQVTDDGKTVYEQGISANYP
jgi:hypothetical protein